MKLTARFRRHPRRVPSHPFIVESLELRRFLTTTKWIGNTSNFNNNANWTAGVPVAGDNAIFETATAVGFNISLSAAPAAFATMQIESGTFTLDLNGFD